MKVQVAFWISCVWTALLAVLGMPATAGAEKTPHRVPRIENTISIDGVLDEPVWERALVMGVNTEVRPGENIPAPVRTDMLLAYFGSQVLGREMAGHYRALEYVSRSQDDPLAQVSTRM